MREKASLLFLLKIFKLPLNLLLLSVTAKYYGISLEKDIWLLALATVTTLDLALWGPINETFRAKFIMVKEEISLKRALYFTQSLLFYFVVFSLLIVLYILFFPRHLGTIIAPTYDLNQLKILSKMLYIVAPFLLLNQLIQVGNSILNAFNVFFVPEISSFFSTIINIILIVLLSDKVGIYALPVSNYVSSLFLMVFILYFFKKHKIFLFTNIWNFKFDGFLLFFNFALPFFVPYFFGQVNTFVEKILATNLYTGAVSIIDFSNRIPNLFYGIVVSIVSTILLPILTKLFISKDKLTFNTEFKNMYHLGFLIILFINSIVLGSGTTIISLLYDKGSILESDLYKIYQLSVLYSISLFGVFTYLLFGISLVASKSSRFYASIGVLAQILVIVLNVIFVRIIGIYIFPISVFLSHLFSGYILYKKYPFRDDLNLNLVKLFTILLIIFLLSLFLSKIIFLDYLIINLGVKVAIIFLVFLLMMYLLKFEEITLLKKIYNSKFRKQK